MTTISSDCIVHDRKYLSKFHANINQLRQTNEFNISILKQLPKRCCSCHGQTGETLFTVDDLRILCHEIQLSKGIPPMISNPVQSIHYVILNYPSTLTPKQRIYKSGRFVGRAGKHLKDLEQTLNVCIQILNVKSSKKFRQSVDKLQGIKTEIHLNNLLVLFTMKSDNNDQKNIEKIKQSLEDEWNKIDVFTVKKQKTYIRSVENDVTSLTSISGDTRWKPKKQTTRDKQKLKQKQYNEQEEVPPQPSVKSISMPKEISKHQKNKRS